MIFVYFLWITAGHLTSPGLAQEQFRALLEGPIIKDDHYSYYCNLLDSRINLNLAYEIKYLFDGLEDTNIPRYVALSSNDQSELDEKYLVGKMKKQMRCQASSYDENNPSLAGNVTITSNYINIGIDKTYVRSNRDSASSTKFNCEACVFESDKDPLLIKYKTTLPIRCSDGLYSDCTVDVNLTTTSNIAIKPIASDNPCIAHFIKNQDDNTFEYQVNISAVKDDFTSPIPRANYLLMRFPPFPDVTVNGNTYPDNWNLYIEQTDLRHYDSPRAFCTVSGYSQIKTFDNYNYQSGAIGQFKYVNTIEGTPFDVQLRHWQCTLDSVESCVCGVAVQENELDVVVDMCMDGTPHFITHGCVFFPTATGVKVIANTDRNRFAILFPSGNRVYVNIVGRQMSLDIYINSDKYSLQNGMCGSFNNDTTDDATMAANIEQWRIPVNQSIFDGYLRPAPDSSDPTETTSSDDVFCQCNNGISTCTNSLINFGAMEQFNYGMTSNVQPRVPADYDGCDFRKDLTYFSRRYMYYYWATASYTSTWPTDSGISQAAAFAYCKAYLWDNSPLKSVCAALTPADLNITFTKCSREIQISGFLDSATNIEPELGRLCLARGAAGATAQGISGLGNLQQMNGAYCESFSCTYNGNCTNGACVCNVGISSLNAKDCSYNRTQTGQALSMYNGPLCDVRTQNCSQILLYSSYIDSIFPKCRYLVVKKYFGSPSITNTLVQQGSNYDENSTICYPALEYLETVSYPSDKKLAATAFGTPLLFNLSVTNDQTQSSIAVPLLLYDSYCYNCTSDLNCTLKTLNNLTTCFIRGYCFVNGTVKPGDPIYYCNTAVSSTAWTLVPTTSTSVAPTTVSGQTAPVAATTVAPAVATTTTISPTTTTQSSVATLATLYTGPTTNPASGSSTTSTTTTTESPDLGLDPLTDLEQFVNKLVPNLTPQASSNITNSLFNLLNNTANCTNFAQNIANAKGKTIVPLVNKTNQENMQYYIATFCTNPTSNVANISADLISRVASQPGATYPTTPAPDIPELVADIMSLFPTLTNAEATNIAGIMLGDTNCWNAVNAAKLQSSPTYDSSITSRNNILNLLKTFCVAPTGGFNNSTVDAIANILDASLARSTTTTTTTTNNALTTPQLIGLIVGLLIAAGLAALLLYLFAPAILACLQSCCFGFPFCCCRGFFATSYCQSDCRPICTPMATECVPKTVCAAPAPSRACIPAAPAVTRNCIGNGSECSGQLASSRYCAAATDGLRGGSMCARKNCHTYLTPLPSAGDRCVGSSATNCCSNSATNFNSKCSC